MYFTNHWVKVGTVYRGQQFTGTTENWYLVQPEKLLNSVKFLNTEDWEKLRNLTNRTVSTYFDIKF